MNVTYYCTGCNYKSATSQGLIQGKGGCTSCGKSGYKCPVCGMGMKMRRVATITKNFPNSIETGVKVNNINSVEQKTNIKIRRVK